MLGLAVVPLIVLLGPRASDGSPAAGASDGSHASMAGPSTFAAIGPTAIPGSSVWNDNLAVPTPDSVATAAPQGPADPDPTKKPGKTPKPDPKPDPTPKPTPKPPKPTDPPDPDPDPTNPPNPAPCQVFPDSNYWNTRIDSLPVHSKSDTFIDSIGIDEYLHPDFSSTQWNDGVGYGIPFNKVDSSTPLRDVSFRWPGESDDGPYPIPASPKIENASDRHIILWDTEGCDLYELFNARKSGGDWEADSGAFWNLRSNALRPDGWTSADAAGLPILPGLVRWDEVADGAIRHAIRFTAPHTRSDHIWPARHDAGEGNNPDLPPMGIRVRLKSSFDISGFGSQARIILTALKRYGMVLADNGSPWYITGAPHANWNDDQLHDFHQITGADFEVVDTSSMH